MKVRIRYTILVVIILLLQLSAGAKGHIPWSDTLPKSNSIFNRGKYYYDEYSVFLNNKTQEIKKLTQQPIVFKKANLELSGLAGNFGSDSFSTFNYNLFDAGVTGTAGGIPFHIAYQDHYYPFLSNHNLTRLSMQYDKDAYLSGLKKQLENKFNPELFLHDFKDPITSLMKAAEGTLKNELLHLKEKYKGALDQKIDGLGNPSDLFNLDPNMIRKKMVSLELLQQMKVKAELMAQLQNRINNGEQVDRTQILALQKELEIFKGTEELVALVESHHTKWKQSGLLQKIKQNELLKKEKLAKVINDPNVIRKVAREKLSLNGLQRLFLSVTKFNIGQGTMDLNRLSANSILNGLNTGFMLNNNRFIDVMAGQQRSFNSLFDLPFSNNIFNSDNHVQGFRFMNGAADGSNTSISVMTFQSLINQGNLPASIRSFGRKSIVIGITRQIIFNNSGSLNVELSKSSGHFANEFNSDSLQVNHRMSELFQTENLLKSIAASVDYTFDNREIGINGSAFVKYSGVNYYNPAAIFLPAGSKEVGANIRKSFLKNRLSFTGRTNFRYYKFSEITSTRWHNENHFFDVKWKMRNGQSVSLRYQPVRTIRVNLFEKVVQTRVDRFSASATITKKIKTLQYRNYLTVAYLNNTYNAGISPSHSRSIQITALQNFNVGKHQFFSNSSYSNVDNSSNFLFFNTSFSSDLGFTYSIAKKISASTSINYNSIKGWYRQIAWRQTLTGQLGRKMNIHIYVDAGKNLKELQPLPYSLFRAEWSIEYLFNQ